MWTLIKQIEAIEVAACKLVLQPLRQNIEYLYTFKEVEQEYIHFDPK